MYLLLPAYLKSASIEGKRDWKKPACQQSNRRSLFIYLSQTRF